MSKASRLLVVGVVVGASATVRSALAQAPDANPPADGSPGSAIDEAIKEILTNNRALGETFVSGVVVDGSTGEPVVSAGVVFLQGDRTYATRTDPEGAFTLAGIRNGPYQMTVEHLAYQPLQDEVEVAGGGVVTRVRAELNSEVIALGAIEVSVDSRPTFGALLPVYERLDFQRSLGSGRFFEREQITELGVFRMGDLLSMVPGVRVSDSNIVLNSVGTARCGMPVVYLDGAKLNLTWDDLISMVPVSQIEVMEVYRRASEVPAEYSGSDSQCGVIAIWTLSG